MFFDIFQVSTIKTEKQPVSNICLLKKNSSSGDRGVGAGRGGSGGGGEVGGGGSTHRGGGGGRGGHSRAAGGALSTGR